jgi:hypothetical protein
MVASREWTEWHLTPRGWEAGSSRVDFQGTTIVEAPADRVATWRYEQTASTGIGDWESGAECLWRSPDGVAIDALEKVFGPCPRVA